MSDEPTLPAQKDVPGERPYAEPSSATSPPEDREHDGGKGGARYQPAEPDDTREDVVSDHSAGERDEAEVEPTAAGVRRDREVETAGKDGAIQVKFDGTGWCIDDPSLDKPVKFERLGDAEHRASELGKTHGRAVCVRGQDGEVIAAYAAPDASASKPSMR
jgi:hypothetical protein